MKCHLSYSPAYIQRAYGIIVKYFTTVIFPAADAYKFAFFQWKWIENKLWRPRAHKKIQ